MGDVRRLNTMAIRSLMTLFLAVVVCTSAINTDLKPAENALPYEEMVIPEDTESMFLEKQQGSALDELGSATFVAAGVAGEDEASPAFHPFADEIAADAAIAGEDEGIGSVVGSATASKQFGSATEADTVAVPALVLGSADEVTVESDGLGSGSAAAKQFGSVLAEEAEVGVIDPEVVGSNFGSAGEEAEIFGSAAAIGVADGGADLVGSGSAAAFKQLGSASTIEAEDIVAETLTGTEDPEAVGSVVGSAPSN